MADNSRLGGSRWRFKTKPGRILFEEYATPLEIVEDEIPWHLRLPQSVQSPPLPQPPLSTSPPPAAKPSPNSEATENEVIIVGVTNTGRVLKKKSSARKRTSQPSTKQAATSSPSNTPPVPKSKGQSSKKKTKIEESASLSGKSKTAKSMEGSPIKAGISVKKGKTEASCSKSGDSKKTGCEAQQSSVKPTTHGQSSKLQNDSSSAMENGILRSKIRCRLCCNKKCNKSKTVASLKSIYKAHLHLSKGVQVDGSFKTSGAREQTFI